MGGRSRIENMSDRSGSSYQVRPRRPFPEVWCPARTMSPSGAPSCARRKASSFVDPKLSWTSGDTPRKRIIRAVRIRSDFTRRLSGNVHHQEREVERRGGMRDRSDGDVLHAGKRELAHVVETDAAGYLDLGESGLGGRHGGSSVPLSGSALSRARRGGTGRLELPGLGQGAEPLHRYGDLARGEVVEQDPVHAERGQNLGVLDGARLGHDGEPQGAGA